MLRTQVHLALSVVLAKTVPARRVFDSTSAHFMVKPWEIDLNLHLNNAMYSLYFARAQGEHFMRTQYIGLLYLQGFSTVVATTHISHVRSVGPFSRLSVDTRLAGCDEKYVYCEQAMAITGDYVVATAIQRMVIVDRQRQKVSPGLALSAIVGDVSMPACPSYARVLRDMAEAQRTALAAHEGR